MNQIPDFRPGDLLRRRKGIFWHVGVAMPGNWILTNSPERGEHVCSFDEFAAGKKVEVKSVPDEFRGVALTLAKPILAASANYNLTNNNCEHTASRAYGIEPHSPQLMAWITAIGLIVGVFALSRIR